MTKVIIKSKLPITRWQYRQLQKDFTALFFGHSLEYVFIFNDDKEPSNKG